MLGNIRKVNTNRIVGIDCSTQSLAYGVIENGKLVEWDEIQFTGRNIYERLLDARHKTDVLANQLNVNHVAIEAAVMVRSIKVAIKMAYVFGAVMGSLLNKNIQVHEVAPLTWQSFIGNKTLTRLEKAGIKNMHPGKSKSWYTNSYRELRKDRTRQWVHNTFGQQIESDNITDSIGLAWFAWNKLVK